MSLIDEDLSRHMNWLTLRIHTTTEGTEAVSWVMRSAGCGGTLIEDRLDAEAAAQKAGTWELFDTSILNAYPTDVIVTGWIKNDTCAHEGIALIKDWLSFMKDTPGFGTLRLEMGTADDEDWQEVWKQYYKPFPISRSITIQPTWEPYVPNPDEKVIRLDPGMAFGTGQHETTQMCMVLMEDYISSGMHVADIGTGSGILAIGAALMGACVVYAVDSDTDAIKTAQRNVKMNGFDDVIQVYLGNLLDTVPPSFDVCVANIVTDAVCALAAVLPAYLKPNGVFICSGIIKQREDEALRALTDAGFINFSMKHSGEWTAIAASYPHASILC